MNRKFLAFVFAFSAGPLAAHDMWIEPSSFHLQPGQIAGTRLRVGQDLIGDPLPRDPSLVNQFIVEDAAGRRHVPGRVGADPAGLVRAGAPGVMVVGYLSNPSTAEQTTDKFNQYLKEEGLEAAARSHGYRPRTGATVSELFARCAKSLLVTGAPGAQSDRTLGFTLELVAEKNPYSLGADDELPIRLTYEGRPLEGALVVAMNRLNAGEKLRARTGKDGRVRFRLGGGGMWMVKAVHLVPAQKGAGPEWMSYWASLTFERPAQTAKNQTR